MKTSNTGADQEIDLELANMDDDTLVRMYGELGPDILKSLQRLVEVNDSAPGAGGDDSGQAAEVHVRTALSLSKMRVLAGRALAARGIAVELSYRTVSSGGE